MKLQENDKNSKKVGKKKFLTRKQQRDPPWDRLVILDVCFDKDGVWFGFQDLNPSERK